MNRPIIITALLVAVATLLGACARSTTPEPDKPSASALVWPAPPAKPRIQYLQSLSRPDDLGITKGFFRRIFELVAGEEENRLVRPMAVSVSSSGVIYVADPGAKGVHRFDIANETYQLILGEQRTPLPSPVGLFVDRNDRLWIADSQLAQVLLAEPQAEEARPVTLEGELLRPTGIAMDREKERFYLVDTEAHKVITYSLAGERLGDFGRRGNGDAEFNYPTMIWQDESGRLLVSDSLNFRVQIFDQTGEYIGKFGRVGDGTGDLSRPKGVATDRFGHIYIADALFHSLQVFDEQGSLLLNLGSQGREPGSFWLPAGLFIAPDDRIFVADAYNSRVQIFRYVGGQL